MSCKAVSIIQEETLSAQTRGGAEQQSDVGCGLQVDTDTRGCAEGGPMRDLGACTTGRMELPVNETETEARWGRGEPGRELRVSCLLTATWMRLGGSCMYQSGVQREAPAGDAV